jgi:hypothetical protein
MVLQRLHQVLLSMMLVVLSGCAELSSRTDTDKAISVSATEKPKDYSQHVRNNAASLLFDLLNDEKNLSKILIIKRESDTLHELVKRISTTASDRAKQLEQLELQDASLNLHVMGLPSGEAATRDAISKTKEQELLHTKGSEFEFRLLLTQTEALNYGAHLAKVAAANDPKLENARTFSQIQNEFEILYREVCARLQHPHGD